MIKAWGLVIVFVLSLSHPAKASLEQVEALDHYRKASQLCRVYSHSGALKKVLTTFEITGSNAYQGVKTALLPKDLSLSPSTRLFINSDGYYQALTECFGSFSSNRLKWDSFTLMIILSDAAGQAVTYYGQFKIIGKLMDYLRFLSHFSNPKNLQVANAYLAKNPQVLKIISRTASLLLGLGTLKLGYDGYQSYRQLFDADFQKEQLQTKEVEALVQLDADYESLLREIRLKIQVEKEKPKSQQDPRRMAELREFYNSTVQEYREHRQKYLH